MDKAQFSKLSPGRLVLIQSNCWAYVPEPLPPQLKPSWELSAAVSEADRAVSELSGVARTLPNPNLLIRPFVRKEAVLSSRIEGTQASLSDLYAFEGAGSSEQSKISSDVQEVASYVKALEYGLSRLAKLPISLRLIRETHEILMSRVRGEARAPGEFRRLQNYIGPPGCTLENAAYVPPPVLNMRDCLDNLEKYLHQPSNLPPLVRLALIHYQFEAIHPFLDGNGRIGRLLITLMMCSERLLSQPLLYLSAFFERHRQDYYRLLLDVSQSGRWHDWVLFFLSGVAEQARDAVNRPIGLLELWHKYRKELQTARSTALMLRIIDFMFSMPIFSVGKLAKELDITVRTAQLNIDKLRTAGILKEITGKQRNRLFQVTDILTIVDTPTAGD